MDPFADDVTADEIAEQERIGNRLDAVVDELVPDSGDDATAEDMEGMYEAQVREVAFVQLVPAGVACAPVKRVRVTRPRRRERRPRYTARRTRRATRAGPSGDPDSSEPGEPEPPPAAGPITARAAR